MHYFKPLHQKVFFALTAVLVLVALTACSRQDGDEKPGGPAEKTLIHPLDAHLDEKYTDDLPGLLERRHIRVLTAFNRTNFFISDGRFYGFEYSLLRDYEKHLNRGLSRRDLKVTLEFIPVARGRLVQALNEGLGDIAAAGLTITPSRLEKVEFTRPYLDDVDEVVVAHDSVKGISSVEDLSGRRVYVRKSSSYHESLVSLNERLASRGLAPVRIVPVGETLETEDILELVNSGALGITVSDDHIAGIWSDVFEHIRVLEGVKLREGARVAWMVRKDNPELKKSLDGFLRKRRPGTLLGNIYFNRYFKDSKWIENPFAVKRTDSQDKAVELIRKYSDEYGFDWMFVLALAYQESGLEHKKRSRAGAVGIMQVRSSTSGGPAVGIDDISSLENNVHAGVKYLAYLRDHYYDDPEISERDRIRFALAAYNAGPTRVARMRARARKMGLDPDRWFRNVEIAALRMVGRETVRYVSNINKYYVAYRLHYQSEKSRSREMKSLAFR